MADGCACPWTDDGTQLVDDGGAPIAAAAEGSALMALALSDEAMEPCAASDEDMARSVAFALTLRAPDGGGACGAESAQAGEEPGAAAELADGGMVGSRAYSDGGEDWTLEVLLSRRRRHGTTWWLCKWHFYDAPTWEEEDALVDMGYGPVVEAYQRRSAPPVPAARAAPLRSGLAALEEYLGSLVETAVRDAAAAGFFPDVAALMSTKRVDALVQRWTTWGPCAPKVVYHGTAVKNVTAIDAVGLVVPGTGHGVRVVHGSAFGTGIYTSTGLGIPVGFAAPHKVVLLCVGLVTAQDAQVVRGSESVLVFREAARVAPVMALRLTSPRRDGATPEVVPLAMLLSRARFGGAAAAEEEPAAAAPLAHEAVTKRMMRRAPRRIKELYRAGALRAKR